VYRRRFFLKKAAKTFYSFFFLDLLNPALLRRGVVAASTSPDRTKSRSSGEAYARYYPARRIHPRI
jgi:hypothetical protein